MHCSTGGDKESIHIAQLAEEEIKVYMDGSGTNGKVGAAATLMQQGKPNRTLHYHLGLEKEHTVHEAELIGILLAIQLIKPNSKVVHHA